MPRHRHHVTPLAMPADTGPCIDRRPDHFAAVGPAVEQIVADIDKLSGELVTLQAKARDMTGAADFRQAVSLQLAATDVATTARQIEAMATTVAEATRRRIDADGAQ